MKRKFASFITFFLALTLSVCLFACRDENEREKTVKLDLSVVTVTERTTALEVMEAMQADGLLTFTISNGFVESLNGTSNGLGYNPCWMLYTSDGEASNPEYETMEYEGKTLAQAVEGASTLVVKSGETYVWLYQRF